MEEVKRTRIEKLFMDNYKKIVIIPLLILVISVAVLGYKMATSEVLNKDISLQGGISLTLDTKENIDINSLQTKLQDKFPSSDIGVRVLTDLTTGEKQGIIIETTKLKSSELTPALEDILKIKITSENSSLEEIGSSLGESFFKELILAIAFAFVFMSIVVLITFRKLVPSMGVILTAATDILATIAIVSIIDLKISTAGIAAFLLLIGYSIDSDILLTTRVLKSKTGTLFERFKSSVKTGLTMTITSIIAVTVGYFVSNSEIIKQIFLIILIGLVIDIIATYLGNAPLIIWYVKNKEKNEAKKNI